jgi:glutaredoxin
MRPVRCQAHDLACGADGLCVVCRREQLGSGSPARSIWAGLAAIAVAMAGGIGYRALAPRSVPAGDAVSLRDVHVVVYTTGWCSVCKHAKTWMASQGIAYEEHDVERSSDDARRMRALNPRGSVPTFDVDGEVLVGFSEPGLLAAMQSAARRQARRQL